MLHRIRIFFDAWHKVCIFFDVSHVRRLFFLFFCFVVRISLLPISLTFRHSLPTPKIKKKNLSIWNPEQSPWKWHTNEVYTNLNMFLKPHSLNLYFCYLLHFRFWISFFVLFWFCHILFFFFFFFSIFLVLVGAGGRRVRVAI